MLLCVLGPCVVAVTLSTLGGTDCIATNQAAANLVHCVCYNVQSEEALVALLELLQQRGAELNSLVTPILYRYPTPQYATLPTVGADTPLHIVCGRRFERAAIILVHAGVDVMLVNWVRFLP